MNSRSAGICFLTAVFFAGWLDCVQAGEMPLSLQRGELIYQNNLSEPGDIAGWTMEGPGVTKFRDGWMEMYSPREEYHHVFWCPEEFPDRFIGEWEAQNLEPDAGLCILFFAAHGVNGEDIFHPSLPERDGDFSGYTRDRINSYHISYYANTPSKPDRGKAHLRKNNGFRRVQEGEEGIPTGSTRIHQLKLIKDGPHIRMFVDGRKIIDWTDTGQNDARPHYREGKIGFRQMQWTHFRYRNFRVWEIADDRTKEMEHLPVIHPKSRIWFEPSGGRVASKNPPTLQWPRSVGEDVNYSIRLSQDPAFSTEDTIRKDGIPWTLFNPHRPLNPGSWYWQVKDNKSQWSETAKFVITSESHAWNPPSPEALIAAVPDFRPRVLADAPQLASFRARAKDRPEASHILTAAESALSKPTPSESRDIPGIRGDDPKKTDKLRKDASRAIGQALYEGVDPLCKAWILTGDPRFADEAIAWAMEAAGWDPNGVTRINDFGDSRIMLSMALVFDTLHPFLTHGQKQKLLKAIEVRAGNFYRDFVNNKESVVLSNHVWQHIFHYFFDTALAVQGDLPEADTWLAYLYGMFLARAPILGGEDGGWVHGLSYFRMNFEVLIDVPQRIKQYTGFDFIEHTPWYRENTYYFLYGFPPGSAGTGFSDNADELVEPRGDYLAYADALSRMVRNPHAAWYRDAVARATGIHLGDTSMLRWYRLKYLYAMPSAEPQSPEELPKARAFAGVGLVTMHSQSLDQPAGNNLFLAMRASPFGTYSHMLADNNSFNMVYGGDRLFYHTGYKVAMSAPHRQLYYKHTKSHNGILMDGEGQPYHTEAYGWMENFLTSERLSYAVGNASNAYDSDSEGFDAGLRNFRRHVVMLRPDIVVLYDELEAEKPVAWSFLLHSYQEIRTDLQDRTVSTDNLRGRARVHLFASSEDSWAVTDEYEIPAENWRGLRDDNGNLIEYPDNAWHFSSKTKKTKRARFLAVFQVKPRTGLRDFDFNELLRMDGGGYRLGKWSIRAAMDPKEQARIEIGNTIDGVWFASSGQYLAAGDASFEGRSAFSAKLAERVEGRWTFEESLPEQPASALSALAHFKESPPLTDNEN